MDIVWKENRVYNQSTEDAGSIYVRLICTRRTILNTTTYQWTASALFTNLLSFSSLCDVISVSAIGDWGRSCQGRVRRCLLWRRASTLWHMSQPEVVSKQPRQLVLLVSGDINGNVNLLLCFRFSSHRFCDLKRNSKFYKILYKYLYNIYTVSPYLEDNWVKCW